MTSSLKRCYVDTVDCCVQLSFQTRKYRKTLQYSTSLLVFSVFIPLTRIKTCSQVLYNTNPQTTGRLSKSSNYGSKNACNVLKLKNAIGLSYKCLSELIITKRTKVTNIQSKNSLIFKYFCSRAANAYKRPINTVIGTMMISVTKHPARQLPLFSSLVNTVYLLGDLF